MKISQRSLDSWWPLTMRDFDQFVTLALLVGAVVLAWKWS